MKLYLFGGAETQLNQAPLLKKQIKDVILSLKPQQIFHVPFARLHPSEEVWKEGWFKETMKDSGVEILDARIEKDILKATNPLIFINGGHGCYDLLNGVRNDKRILQLILIAEYIVAESAGSKLMGEGQRGGNNEHKIIDGLGILKNTIIEPHYTERGRQQLLKDEIKLSGMKYGVGIDSITALVVDPQEFPAKWEKIGVGNVDIIST
ncbi:Type 1 glutamine amidotransferase-like domain-containing protein [Candidatus Roizmanbacteria bacterium]|nr:Type 1 glutamine amidotransferase-like domain-containing protein [Candidatus Roizmanbacteria bacterium]